MKNLFDHRFPLMAQNRLLACVVACVLMAPHAGLHAQALSQQPASDQVLIQEAEKLFQQKNYYEAAQYYEMYLDEQKSAKTGGSPFAVRKNSNSRTEEKIAKQRAIFQLAESYRLYNNFRSAEKWYKEATKFSIMSYPISTYWYGVSLRANQKVDDAIKVISEFREKRTVKDEWTIAADRELENLRFIKAQQKASTGTYTVTHHPHTSNTSAYALAAARDLKVFFTSVWVDSAHLLDGNPTFEARLYESIDSGRVRENAKRILIPETEGYHNGLPSLTPDGQQVFYTRWKKTNGVIESAIYSSHRNPDGSWLSPVKLSPLINAEGSNNTQPFITADGRYLFFASDRAGGFGKYDIWYAPLNLDQSPLSVHNLGIFINTPGDESSPWLHPKTGQLVFSSNGHVGMGGYDIFVSKGDVASNTWEHPFNPGAPVNSTKDDQYYVGTDPDNVFTRGWLSSDRESDCCLDLYTVTQENKQFISGTVVDEKTRQPLANSTVYVRDTKDSGKLIIAMETDSTGHYYFELRNKPTYEIVAFKDKYDPDSMTYHITVITGRDSIRNDTLSLRPNELFDPDVGKKPLIPPETAIEKDVGKDREKEPPDKVYDPDVGPPPESFDITRLFARFDFDKSELLQKYYRNMDTLVSIMKRNPSMKVELDGHTDGFGEDGYNMRLSTDRIDACINYLVQHGISHDRLFTRAYGETLPLVPETKSGKDDAGARSINRRVEFRILNGSGFTSAGAGSAGKDPGGRPAANETQQPGDATRTADTRKTGNPGDDFGLIVHFSFDKSKVDQEYYNNLDRLSELMKKDPSMRVTMSGYTDCKGSVDYNLRLAQHRLDAVVSYLATKGISSDRLSGKALGECCPLEPEVVAGSDNPTGRWMNRRVEFRFVRNE